MLFSKFGKGPNIKLSTVNRKRGQKLGAFSKKFAKKKPSDAFQGTHLRVEIFIAEDF